VLQLPLLDCLPLSAKKRLGLAIGKIMQNKIPEVSFPAKKSYFEAKNFSVPVLATL
jgi:hypothetical protein